MKKNVKILILVGAAAAVLVGIMLLLIFLPKGDSNGGEATYDEGISMHTSTDKNGEHQAVINTDKNGKIKNNSYGTLIDYVPAKISKIHVENKKGTLDIKSYTPVDSDGNTDTTQYTLVGYEDFDLQTGIPDEIANDAASIQFSKVMTLEKSKASDYGLDKPRATVNVTYTDKTKATIYVGNNAPQEAGTYIKFGKNDTVYLVTVDAVSSFDYGVTDLISLTINDSASNDSNAQATSITLSGSAFPKSIVLEPNNGTKNSASYLMTSPDQRYANESESSLVSGAIRGLYAESVKMTKPTGSQLSSVGLSNPYAHITAKYPDATVDLIASKPDGDGKVYVMKKGGVVVYVMSAENLPWVNTSYKKLVNEYVLYPKMTELSSVSVNDGKKTYDFKLKTKNTKVKDTDGSETTTTSTTVKNGKKDIDIGYFTTFYQNMAMVELADADASSYSGTPKYTVTYTYSSDGTTDVVSFYKSDSSRYVAVINGKAMGHTYQSKINKLINQVSQIADNKQVESFA